jgi:outer membrane protein OmpA-like peptidoglycan-associated protein
MNSLMHDYTRLIAAAIAASALAAGCSTPAAEHALPDRTPPPQDTTLTTRLETMSGSWVDTGAAQTQAQLYDGERTALAMRLAVSSRDSTTVESAKPHIREQKPLDFSTSDLLFLTGGTALESTRIGDLSRLALYLNRHQDLGVSLEGHTDNVGSVQENASLSLRRADVVRDYLLVQGVQSNRVRAFGSGEHDPIADNASAGGRRHNRRVEVLIRTATES